MVAKTVELVTQQTIDIPRILVVPKGEVKSGFKPFTLKLDSLKYPAVSDELWIQHLRTNQLEVLSLGRGGIEEARLEDYVVSGLVDFDDISYDDHADLLYDLAGADGASISRPIFPRRTPARCCAATSGTSPSSSTRRCRPTTGRRRSAMR